MAQYICPYRDVVRDNSLINMSGRDGHYHGVDKNAETNINFQKVNWVRKGSIVVLTQLYRISWPPKLIMGRLPCSLI